MRHNICEDAYFAYSLPDEAPDYIHPSKKEYMTTILKTVAARMDKLEQARMISGLDGETFSEYIKPLFDKWPERIDTMTANQIGILADELHTPGYQAPQRLEWPNCDVVVDAAFTTTKEWEAVRHLGIGGSDSSVVVGVAGAYRSRYDLYHDKRWTPVHQKDSGKQAIFDRGHILEPQVIKTFCNMVGAEVVPETRMFRSKKYPHALADVDAIIHFPGQDYYYIFEAKSAIAQKASSWYNDSIPANYLTQITHYPAVLNDDRIKGVYISCLFTQDYVIHDQYVGSNTNVGDFVSRYAERNADEEENILQIAEEFFQNHILCDAEPELCGDPQRDVDSLNAVIGPVDVSLPPVMFDSSFASLASEYLTIKEKMTDLSSTEQTARAEMDACAAQLCELINVQETEYMTLSQKLTDLWDAEKIVLHDLEGILMNRCAVVSIPPENQQQVDNYIAAKEQWQMISAQKEQLEKTLKAKSLPFIAVLEQSVEGRLEVPSDFADNTYWEIKNAPRPQTTVDKEMLEHKYPEAFRDCVHKNPAAYRVFSLKQKKQKTKKK